MADEKQARLEARARIDIRKLYERGEITLKDHASAIGYLRGVWFDHLSDIEIEISFAAKSESWNHRQSNQPSSLQPTACTYGFSDQLV
jgi:hypothetical protein